MNKEISYLDFKENIDILYSIMKHEKFNSNDDYQKNHTFYSMYIFERMLKDNYITNVQRQQLRSTVKSLKELTKEKELEVIKFHLQDVDTLEIK